ncbi:S1C family serine protease [Patescibacteria group bacterium]
MKKEPKINVKKILIIAAGVVVVLVVATGGAVADRVFGLRPLDLLFPSNSNLPLIDQRVVREENVVIDVNKKVSPSVVTVSVETPQRRILSFDIFGGFSSQIQGGQPQDIGTGFIVSSDGLVVTNKHVVGNTTAAYKVITNDNKEYEVKQISRDPNNDIAVLKIDANTLSPVILGDSSNLQVGQYVIAIGTALGEFRNTVTQGVISGLGRGIQAGNPLEGYVEKLDDVIQTDAAINPGNSGGPLVNVNGEVIGINVAVAQGANSIGFAIPINTVKEALNQYNANGKFPAKAYLGVQYQLVSKQSAILNNVPQGAYVVDVISGSPAEEAGIQVDDIIVKLDDESVADNKDGLAGIINNRKVGDTVKLEIWRSGETTSITVTFSEFQQ